MHETPAVIGPLQLVRLIVRYPLHWLLPMVVGAIVAGGVWTWRGDRWEASQPWMVRNKASGNTDGPGKFRTEELKAAQDTIHELVKNTTVLAEALETVGPPANYEDPAAWPTAEDIADLQEHVRLTSPEGAPFGSTEIFYLKVRDKSKERAVVLASAIGRHVEDRFQQLSGAKAASMIAELRNTVELAEADLGQATARLTAKERAVGSDLGELRILSEALSNNSDVRQRTIELENELRAARTADRANEQLLELLREAQQDRKRLLAAPNSLLESQPAIKRLKEGLVDAQLRTAQAQSSMTPAHPAVQAARTAETEIWDKLTTEIDVAIRE
jgi:succinoglycan biosynthesis transport protein ExoP